MLSLFVTLESIFISKYKHKIINHNNPITNDFVKIGNDMQKGLLHSISIKR